MPELVQVTLTTEQQEAIAEYLGRDLVSMNEYQICEMVNDFIDAVLG